MFIEGCYLPMKYIPKASRLEIALIPKKKKTAPTYQTWCQQQ